MSEKDLRKETQEVEENKKQEKGKQKVGVKYMIYAILFVVILVATFISGQKSERKEANAKVEAANVSVMAIIGATNVRIVDVQQEANLKVQLLESKLQEEYTEEEYTLLENFFDIVCRYRKGEKVFRYEMEDAVKMEKVIDELPYFGVLEEIDEKKILEYINTLKEVADKYPLASNVNQRIIDKLERVEKEHKDKIHSTATFKALDALKKKCEDNIARWYVSEEKE